MPRHEHARRAAPTLCGYLGLIRATAGGRPFSGLLMAASAAGTRATGWVTHRAADGFADTMTPGVCRITNGSDKETIPMPLTPSTMAPLGTPAPDFRLTDTDGRAV